MKSRIRSALAAVVAGVALAGCASYDYGSGYTYTEPYNGYRYGYDDGPYPYDYSPYYYGSSDYVGPSVGLGFMYRDGDWGNYDRSYNGPRNTDAGHDNDYRHGDNNHWRSDPSRSRPVAPPPAQGSGRDDPWGGTNNRYDPSWQQ